MGFDPREPLSLGSGSGKISLRGASGRDRAATRLPDRADQAVALRRRWLPDPMAAGLGAVEHPLLSRRHHSGHHRSIGPRHRSGFLRRKLRTERRPGLPIEHPLIFHPKRAWNAVATNAALLWYGLRMWALAKRIKYDPATRNYTDAALAPSPDDELELLKNLVAAPASTRIERDGEPLQTAP